MSFPPTGGQMRAEGVIQQQGLTTYMYGSHVLTDPGGQVLYALTSDDPSLLERYVGQRVQVAGAPVPGYPLEGGPLHLHVTGVTPAP
jgi:hypothetical protein